MKKIALLLILSCAAFVASSQNYRLAAGLRAGLPVGITAKYFHAENTALEFIAAAWARANFNSQLSLTVLYERHWDLNVITGLAVFAGGGGHAGVVQQSLPNTTGGVFIGLDGIVGAEYTFDFPLSLSLDIKPSVNFLASSVARPADAALSARFVIQ